MSASVAGCRMRFSRATAVKWVSTWQREGRAEALPIGGDRRSGALEAYADEQAREDIAYRGADLQEVLVSEIALRAGNSDGCSPSSAGIGQCL